MQLLPGEEEPAEGEVELLTALGNVEPDVARRVFRKHKGDMQKAADALLSGDKGEEDLWNPRHPRHPTPERGYFDSDVPTIGPQLPSAHQSVIDLTRDQDTDGELNRALQMSMETSTSGTKFGPSNRAPHPDWQVVASNVQVGPGITQEDQTLNDAIQASLNDFTSDESEAVPFKATVREGGRPVAIRPDVPSLACAALVVQALYFVPQIRAAVGRLRLPDVNNTVPLNHPARAVWNLIELFTNMDLAQLSAIVDENVLPSLEDGKDRDKANDTPSQRASDMIGNLVRTIEAHISAQQEDDEPTKPSLFAFTHLNVELNNRFPRKVGRQNAGGVVRIEYGNDSEKDLISCLSSILSRFEESKSFHDVIVEPSEMIAFNLLRQPNTSTLPKVDPDPFVYPTTFYLDRFLFRNLDLANKKRVQEHDMTAEIRELTNHRQTLTRSNNRDSLQDLRNTIYYYEHVADGKGDVVRQQTIRSSTEQLKDILMILESKIEDIDHKIDKLQADLSSLYDCPELQEFRYDLRAVLMHTGLPGRRQLYSYVQDADGVWWKTLDHEVTEVPEETVLTDPTGIHLSAGPFSLLYSKHVPPEELHEPVAWPRIFSDPVEDNNRKFLDLLEPELAAKVKVPTPLNLLSSFPTSQLRTGQYLAPPRSGSMGPRPVNRAHSRAMDLSVD